MTVLARARVVLEGDVAQLHMAFAQAESMMEKTGRRMEEIGRDITTKVTVPMVGLGTAAVHAAAQFDHTMRKTAALTSMTMEQTDALRGSVREMGIQYGASAREAAEGLLFIATPSLTVSQTMDVLRESLKGAAIGLGETKAIALGSVGAMNAYAKQGMTATRATEILAAGVKFGRFEAAELVPVLSRLTGIAAAMGISFEDVVGTLAALTLTGSNTYEASTQLSAIMSTLMGTSQEGEKILQGFGLSLEELRKTAAGPGGLIQVFRELDAATGGNLEKLEAVFPNIRALRGVMNALAQDSKVVDRALHGVRDSVGLLDKAFSIFAKSPAHMMKMVLGQLKDALIELGNVLIPVVVPMLQQLGRAVQNAALWFKNLNPQVQTWILQGTALLSVLGPLLLVLGAMLKILSAFKFTLIIGGLAGMAQGFLAVGAAVKGFMWWSGLSAAFTSLAAGGAGFTGVLWTMRAALLAIGTAALPWLAGGAVLLGLGLILKKWVDMKLAVAQATAAMREATEAVNQHLGGMNKKQASAAWTRLALIVRDMEARVAALRAEEQKWLDLAKSNPKARDMFSVRADSAKTAREEVEQSIAHYKQQLQILSNILTRQEEVTQAGAGKGGPKSTPVPPWLVPAQAALEALRLKLQQIQSMEALLGDQFNHNEAEAKAYGDAVQALVEAGVPLTDPTMGRVLKDHANKLVFLQKQLDLTEQQQEEWNATMDAAKGAVEAAQTPFDVYQETLRVLNAAVEAGVITWQQYDAAVAHAKQTLSDATDKTKTLAQGLTDLAVQGVGSFVDEIFTAKANWGDFFQQMLVDIAKLIVKMQLLKLLFPKGAEGGLFGIPGFARGGFLGGGQVGLVGEHGPELVMAGRSGLTVTPMPAMATAGGDGGGMGGNMTVAITVTSMDSRDVSRFFEENEGLVAGAMMKAWQRTSLLARGMTGRR